MSATSFVFSENSLESESVSVAPGAERLPYVMDGASDFFYELFGPKAGQHARTVLGVADLPNGIAIEINGEFELKA
jgi:enamine deaminase RidA (YjgF/YER057c/UK114 family)